MILARSEFLSLAGKAARGAGLSDGQASCLRGAAWILLNAGEEVPERLLSIIEAGLDRQRADLFAVSSRLQSRGPISAVRDGPGIGFWLHGAGERVADLAAADDAVWLSAVIAFCGRGADVFLTITLDGNPFAECHGGRIVYSGMLRPSGALKVRPSIAARLIPCAAGATFEVEITATAYEALTGYSNRMLVEESDRSRRFGAGYGG